MLGQLLRLSESFEMEAQPQLLLLQKNMLMAEGVSRQLNPALNIWTLAQPLVEQWMRENRGPEARIADALADMAGLARRLPKLLADAERIMAQLADGGLTLAPETVRALARQRRQGRIGGWLGLIAFAALALAALALVR